MLYLLDDPLDDPFGSELQQDVLLDLLLEPDRLPNMDPQFIFYIEW